MSDFFTLLSSPVSLDDPTRAAAYACAIVKQRFPTLHTDGGLAFGPLCEEVDRERTSCAIHLESKVAACGVEVKNMVKRSVVALLWYFCIALAVVYTSGLFTSFIFCTCSGVHQWVVSLHSFFCRLLYDRYLSVHMAFQLRDELIDKVKKTTNLDSKIRKWIESNFTSNESLFRNCQAMRNHIFTFWFKATSLLECLFGHIKKDNKNNLKKGRLFEVLSDLFFFFNIRLNKIAADLSHLLSHNEFMETNPPKKHVRADIHSQRGSVGWRWQQQIMCLAACKVVQVVGNIVTSHQRVIPEGKILESVTIVHITCLDGFLWKDSAENVPPTCCCPENRNGKGVCCGIMAALQDRQEFTAWFGNNWFKRELLARRHRCDCDPFLEILQRANNPTNVTTAVIPAKRASTQQKSGPTPSSIASKIQVMLHHLQWCTPVGCFTCNV
jgi:hypothetical protein